jgi:hypothetical protein
MVGDRLDGVRLTWTEWLGGYDHTSHRRECTGSIEHIATGWVLIRRPHGGLVHRQLRPMTVAAFRLAAVREGAEHINLLNDWCEDDERTRAERRRRISAARTRHAAEQAEVVAYQAERAALADDPDNCPY